MWKGVYFKWNVISGILFLFLFCFKGGTANKWIIYKKEDGLPNNFVHSIVVDRENVWIGTDEGIGRYNKKEKKWDIILQVGGKLKYNFINVLAIDGDNLWIGTPDRADHPIIRYNIKKDEWVVYKGIGSDGINTICVDEDSVYIGGCDWIPLDKNCTFGQYSKISDNMVYVSPVFEFNAPSEYITCIVVDKNNLWIGTDKGLTRYDKKENKWENYTKNDGLLDNLITSLAIDKNLLWIGTFFGVSCYDIEKKIWTNFTEKEGLVNNWVFCIGVDGEDVWFGTYKGISRYNKKTKKWENYTMEDGLSCNQIYSIAVDEDSVWFGTEDGGVCRYLKRKR